MGYRLSGSLSSGNLPLQVACDALRVLREAVDGNFTLVSPQARLVAATPFASIELARRLRLAAMAVHAAEFEALLLPLQALRKELGPRELVAAHPHQRERFQVAAQNTRAQLILVAAAATAAAAAADSLSAPESVTEV